ncbi:unnamed protein product [Ostreobium quekettii]|uniref:Uncharacterized protein n=1 Tax=Ostreobium quekettii TaxID=121088 RepID=A0A8S1ITN9_9CHLO|nr:unnamed protein product [Ostreobium quekettii]|eukprot:evm.model.scf_579.1 EVM.evm.TU.scf_579.1   scf_579:11725-15576(+)
MGGSRKQPGIASATPPPDIREGGSEGATVLEFASRPPRCANCLPRELGKMPEQRPEGTDGSDHLFRMLIEDRYHRLAILKKFNRIFFYCNIVLMVLMSAWHLIPLLEGQPYPKWAQILLALEVTAVVFWYISEPGTGREKLRRLKLYGFLTAVVCAEHLLTRLTYHGKIKIHEHDQYPKVASRYLAANYEVDRVFAQNFLTAVEASLDTLVFVSLLLASLVCRNYILERRAPQTVEEEKKAL